MIKKANNVFPSAFVGKVYERFHKLYPTRIRTLQGLSTTLYQNVRKVMPYLMKDVVRKDQKFISITNIFLEIITSSNLIKKKYIKQIAHNGNKDTQNEILVFS